MGGEGTPSPTPPTTSTQVRHVIIRTRSFPFAASWIFFIVPTPSSENNLKCFENVSLFDR
jgi:hypothetical protein